MGNRRLPAFYECEWSVCGIFVVINDLVPNDTNEQPDIFVRDLVSHTTRRVSVASDGTEATSRAYDFHISPNGRYVAFITGSALSEDDSDDSESFYVHDREIGTTEYIPIRALGASCPVISSDGKYVAFLSPEILVPGIPALNLENVFVYDRENDSLTYLSKRYDGNAAMANSRPLQCLKMGAILLLYPEIII